MPSRISRAERTGERLQRAGPGITTACAPSSLCSSSPLSRPPRTPPRTPFPPGARRPTLTGGTVALAAGQVVWVEERGTGAALVAAGEDGVPRDITTLPPVKGGPRSHSVAASGTTAFLQRQVCADTNCRRSAAHDLVRVDLTTGAATPFDGCLGLAACRECTDVYHFAFGLRGDVLGISGRCARDAGVIDLATGETRRVPERILAAAGRYVASSSDEQTLIVSDWRTGETIHRVDDVSLTNIIDQVALDADGTLAWSYGAGVYVLAPGAAQPRTVPREPERLYDVALAAGRLATRTNGGNVEPVTFQVDDRKVEGQRNPYGWAFDGTRLAWAAEPCGNPVIQVWDLATDPPPPANDRCIRARFADVEARPQRRGRHGAPQLSCRPPHAAARARSPPTCSRAAGRSRRRAGGSTGSRAGDDRHPAAARRAPRPPARPPAARRPREGRQHQRLGPPTPVAVCEGEACPCAPTAS